MTSDQAIIEAMAQAVFESRQKGASNCYAWTDSGLDDEHPGARASYLGDARSAFVAIAPMIHALQSENARLRTALSFYRDEWVTNSDGDPSVPGGTRSWLEPTNALYEDEGRIAGDALDKTSVTASEKSNPLNPIPAD